MVDLKSHLDSGMSVEKMVRLLDASSSEESDIDANLMEEPEKEVQGLDQAKNTKKENEEKMMEHSKEDKVTSDTENTKLDKEVKAISTQKIPKKKMKK
jgi:hypothetical protein